MAGKWLELLKESVPSTKSVTVLFNPDNPAMPGQLLAVTKAAPSLGLQIIEGKIRDRDEIVHVLDQSRRRSQPRTAGLA